MRPLVVIPVVCAALALGSCTSGTSSEVADEPTEPTSSSPAPTRPQVGDCHRLDARELLGSADPEDAVDCDTEHTSQTVHVGTFRAAAAGQSDTLPQDQANQVAARTCRTNAASYLGTAQARMRLTRVEVFWFVPTPAEVDAGADWLRCDVVVLRRDDELMRLPRSMKGALSTPADREDLGLCGTARPGADDFSRVVCAERHSWRAITAIDLEGGNRYPGTRAVRSGGEEECRGQARAAQGGALQYDYGWEWPTRAQWEAGQRHGYCWAPA